MNTTPTDDAKRHVEYFRALIGLGVTPEQAMAMTIAFIQAEAMRELPLEPPTRPQPRRLK